MVVCADAPDDDFVAQVVSALKSLYDFPALLQHPLARMLAPATTTPDRRGNLLRTCVMEAIAAVTQGGRVPAAATPARPQQALRLRYVEGCTIPEVARELALSERQAHRYIRQGELEVAAVLWARHCQMTAEATRSRDESLDREVQRLPLAAAEAPLATALEQAVNTVAPMLREECCTVTVSAMGGLVARADLGGLRQCVTAMLSYAAQSCGSVLVSATQEGPELILGVGCCDRSRAQPGSLEPLLATGRALAEAIGASLVAQSTDDRPQFWLHLPAANVRTILVVDDNEGLADLFERYLAPTGLRVASASCAEDGIRMAQHSRPAAIVLDILMPGTDGWTLLTKLKSEPDTATVPAIVCSVFNDPHLARTLGAAAFLPKPVSQADLLKTLESLGLT
ncbi:MAG: response regulator [Anaerolineae bacterium]